MSLQPHEHIKTLAAGIISLKAGEDVKLRSMKSDQSMSLESILQEEQSFWGDVSSPASLNRFTLAAWIMAHFPEDDTNKDFKKHKTGMALFLYATPEVLRSAGLAFLQKHDRYANEVWCRAWHEVLTSGSDEALLWLMISSQERAVWLRSSNPCIGAIDFNVWHLIRHNSPLIALPLLGVLTNEV